MKPVRLVGNEGGNDKSESGQYHCYCDVACYIGASGEKWEQPNQIAEKNEKE